MKWETPKQMIEASKKYASICEDLAIKSEEDQDYWFYWHIAKLLRAMGSKIEEMSSGQAYESPPRFQSSGEVHQG